MTRDQHTVAPTDLDLLAAAYELGGFREVRFLPDGRMNRNWFLDTDRGRFALKLLTDRDPGAVRRNLGLLDRLAAAGVPVARPLATTKGELVLQVGGNAYYLCEWIDGEHPGPAMTLAQAEHMGGTFARVHLALANPDLGLPAPEATQTVVIEPSAAFADIERFRKHADDNPIQNDFDRRVVAVLDERRELITANIHRRPDSTDTGLHGWTHGDCQDFNLIWSGDRIAAVIDWDRVRVGSYAEEIVRATAWQFCDPNGSIDLDKLAAFLTGYRAVRRLDAAALATAARHRWWRILTHYWHLEFHYDRNDPTCDDLFFDDHRLITWWTKNLEAVEATFAAG